jgi:hypothetical protein
MATADERQTIRTVMDLQFYDHEGDSPVFRQRVDSDHTGMLHSYAMEFSDWDALGRPVTITMTLAAADEDNESI